MAGLVDMDRGWDRLVRELERLPQLKVKVGWPAEKSGDQPHETGKVRGREFFFKSLGEKRTASALHELGHDVLSNAQAAQLQEYGAPELGIPAGGVLGATFDANRPAIEAKVQQLAADILDGKGTARSALAALGTWFAELLRAALGGGTPALLSPGAGRQVVDIEKLRSAVAWVVVSG